MARESMDLKIDYLKFSNLRNRKKKKWRKWIEPQSPVRYYQMYQHMYNKNPRKKGTERIFERLMAKPSQIWCKHYSTHPIISMKFKKENSKIAKCRHTIIKISYAKAKERTMKATREKWLGHSKGPQ